MNIAQEILNGAERRGCDLRSALDLTDDAYDALVAAARAGNSSMVEIPALKHLENELARTNVISRDFKAQIIAWTHRAMGEAYDRGKKAGRALETGR